MSVVYKWQVFLPLLHQKKKSSFHYKGCRSNAKIETKGRSLDRNILVCYHGRITDSKNSNYWFWEELFFPLASSHYHCALHLNSLPTVVATTSSPDIQGSGGEKKKNQGMWTVPAWTHSLKEPPASAAEQYNMGPSTEKLVWTFLILS